MGVAQQQGPQPFQAEIASLRERLREALRQEDDTARKLEIAALVVKLVETLGLEPVVVGGLAVQYWTDGAYVTADIDLLLPEHPQLDARFAAIGFERRGRHWILPGEQILVEAPGSHPDQRHRIVPVASPGGTIVGLLSPEDLAVYRMHEFVATGARDAALQAVTLLQDVPELDRLRLQRRASEEDLGPTLAELNAVAERIHGGGKIEPDELHELALRLRSGLYDRD